MKLSRVLLVAGAGVLVYKALKMVSVVKLQVPREVAELDLFVGDISKAIFDYAEDIEAGEDKEKAVEKLKETLGVTKIEMDGERIAKNFENTIKNNESKSHINVNDKIVELATERPISIHDANYEVAKEVQESTDKAKQLIEEYHENYKEVTV
ncbi:MAG: hypothetical protein ACTTI7_00405 [Gemella haemolysans]|uniref:hypothetical protein n=1 Tax=Gemella haemolysans TaxID=1379 RepID=UPI003FA0784B